MRERFLLDRIDAEPGRAPVRREHHAIARSLAHETQPALTFLQRAIARAHVASNAIALRVPEARRVTRVIDHAAPFATL